MNHNAVYVQLLTVAAILAPAWLVLVSGHTRSVRIFAEWAAIAALLSILTTRFGNVPINRLMTVWEANGAPADWRDVLDKWNMYNNIRTVFALASFLLVLAASQINGSRAKSVPTH